MAMAQLVQEISDILKNYSTEILVASIKSTEDACPSIFAGVKYLISPYTVLTNPITHPFSEQTMKDLQANGSGIAS